MARTGDNRFDREGARPSRAAIAIVGSFLGVACGIAWAEGEGVEHPSLVKVDPELCVACHDDLLEGPGEPHAPADDCTTCHDIAISETGTRVALVYAEPELCLACHDDKSDAATGELISPHAPVTDSCLNCHDAHASDEHALLNASTAELCATCHDRSGLDEAHGGQLTSATNCLQCHEPHGSSHARMLKASESHRPFADGSCKGCHRSPFGDRVRLRSRGERLCTACHGSFETEAGNGGSVHAALEGAGGRAGCLGCHDPHMSDRSALLLRSGSELCGPCHDRIVDSAASEGGHAPASDDCTNCHRPHVAEHPRLLAASSSDLCTTCHDASDDDLAATHLGADLATIDCTGCHDPHGSTGPGLLAANVHPPIEDGCETCHENGADGVMEDGESSLCLMCHDDVGAAAAGAATPHAALEVGRCADCHNPHASAQPALVRGRGGEVCVACHDDKAPGPGEFAHTVVELLGCQACHEPHGGERAAMLRVEGDDLCLGCHDSDRVDVPADGATASVLGRFSVPATTAATMAGLQLSSDKQHGHPMRDHRVAGQPTEDEIGRAETTYVRELTCLTCHDPHKGRARALFRWEAASSFEACSHCHPK